jgi:hypothetical protein
MLIYKFHSRFAAQNGSTLAKAGITHILSVTTDSIPYPSDQRLEIKRVEIEDYPDEVRLNSLTFIRAQPVILAIHT